jgi:hypothetical protein
MFIFQFLGVIEVLIMIHKSQEDLARFFYNKLWKL